jgi:hypothetical protein
MIIQTMMNNGLKLTAGLSESGSDDRFGLIRSVMGSIAPTDFLFRNDAYLEDLYFSGPTGGTDWFLYLTLYSAPSNTTPVNVVIDGVVYTVTFVINRTFQAGPFVTSAFTDGVTHSIQLLNG